MKREEPALVRQQEVPKCHDALLHVLLFLLRQTERPEGGSVDGRWKIVRVIDETGQVWGEEWLDRFV